MALEWGVPFIECSAKYNMNIEDIFQKLIAHTEARQVSKRGGGLFLMSEVPLYRPHRSPPGLKTRALSLHLACARPDEAMPSFLPPAHGP